MKTLRKRILVVFGTRPEAIKLAPVVRALTKLEAQVSLKVCVTGQHREMLDPVLALFGIVPDWDLQLMRSSQDLTDITAGVLAGMRDVLRSWLPDLVLVQGDTSTAFAAALAAFYDKIPVGHVEAGLRTGDRYTPWPEEINRKLTAVLATHHFAPTLTARSNLIKDGVPAEAILVTGNTVIDALLHVAKRARDDRAVHFALEKRFPFLTQSRRLVVVTAHRREHFGEAFEGVCNALRRLAARTDIEIVYPVHLNPNVQEPVRRILGGISNIHLIEPLDYLPFVALLDRSFMILTDSGGIQEEAPSLGKPVLVLRTTTERPEAIAAGTVRLVGTNPNTIVAEAERLLDVPSQYEAMRRAHNPYGDGRAAQRIANAIALDSNDAWCP